MISPHLSSIRNFHLYTITLKDLILILIYNIFLLLADFLPLKIIIKQSIKYQLKLIFLKKIIIEEVWWMPRYILSRTVDWI